MTRDQKEDWWWRRKTDFIGPRPELTLEYHQLTGRRLFLMRPADLLARASVLDVEVDQASSADAERIALSETAPPTPGDVARWMLDELDRTGSLLQADAVRGIEREFGPSFIYENENGNPAIDPDVLHKFRELNEDDVIWDQVGIPMAPSTARRRTRPEAAGLGRSRGRCPLRIPDVARAGSESGPGIGSVQEARIEPARLRVVGPERLPRTRGRPAVAHQQRPGVGRFPCRGGRVIRAGKRLCYRPLTSVMTLVRPRGGRQDSGNGRRRYLRYEADSPPGFRGWRAEDAI